MDKPSKRCLKNTLKNMVVVKTMRLYNEKEFTKWVDRKVHQHLDKEYPSKKERKRSHEFYDIIYT